MSSSVVGSAPVVACSELEVDHPPNDAATCWWLSVNFALFHKKRPELDAYFSDTSNVSSTGTVDRAIINKFKLTSELKTNYENIYKHYTNTKVIAIKDLIEYRVRTDMPAAFNVGGSDAFVINGSKNQPAEEYLLKVTEYIPFSGFISPLVIKDKENNGQLYDLYIHKHYYGSTQSTNSLTKSTGRSEATEQFQLNYNTTHTIIISFKRKPVDGTFIQDEIKLLEKITLPLIDPASRTDAEKKDLDTSYTDTLTSDSRKKYTDIQIKEMVGRRDYSYLRDIPITDKETLKKNLKLETFSLDAIVEATGTHFNTYVKCGETGQWGFYNAMSGGKINKDLTDFNKLPADLVKRATILFYSREGTAASIPSTSVAIPEPLPGPPGSAALPAGLPAPPSSALAVPASLPAPPALAADADVPAPLPEPPALAAAADADVPAPLPEPPAPLPEPPVPPPPAAAASAAPPPPAPAQPPPAPPAAP